MHLTLSHINAVKHVIESDKVYVFENHSERNIVPYSFDNRKQLEFNESEIERCGDEYSPFDEESDVE